MNKSVTVEETALLNDLREAGYAADSLDDLITSRRIPPEAVAILLRHLVVTQDRGLKEWIIRSLATSEVKLVQEASPTLVREFLQVGDDTLLKWAVANTLEVIADRRDLPQLLEIVQDRQHGIARQMIALALGNIGDSSAIPVLIAGLSDEDINGHCIIALVKLRAKEAVPQLRKLKSHSKAWIRSEAKRALKRIESNLSIKPQNCKMNGT